MKSAIAYDSRHHGNTRKLVGGIAKGHPDQNDLANVLAFYTGLQHFP